MNNLRFLGKADKEALDVLSVQIFGQVLDFEGDSFRIGLGLFNESGALLGFITGQAVFEQAEIYFIGVDPRSRSLGFGNQLLKAFISACQQKEAEALFLEVKASNKRAISFYKKHGFKHSGTRKKYYPNGEDAVLMNFDLGGC